jgi:heat-inducible transcriptional repressor
MLTDRQNQLLKTIVRQYIETAQPVGSEWLAENFKLDKKKISPATIRNEMSVLLDKGFLSQPHTSAGRVPTEKAYHYYIKNFVNPNDLEQRQIKQIEKFKNKTGESMAKELSQMMAELTGELAIVALDKNNFYYTGFSNLFSQPEFSQSSQEIYGLGQIFDRLDNIVGQVFDQVEDEPQVLLGRDNPFGDLCSTILTRIDLPNQKDGVVFGLLGPLRMDYSQNLALINYVKKMLNN